MNAAEKRDDGRAVGSEGKYGNPRCVGWQQPDRGGKRHERQQARVPKKKNQWPG